MLKKINHKPKTKQDCAGPSIDPGHRAGSKKKTGEKSEMADSHEIARRVLPRLSELNVPVTPTNYRIWYAYYSDGYQELKDNLDRLLKDEIPFTRELSQSLYQRYFSQEALENQSRLVDRTSSQVQDITVEIIKKLLATIARSSQYSISLSGYIEEIEKAADLAEVQEIINEILADTDTVIAAQNSMQRQMEQTSLELTQLQAELRRREELANTDELTRLYNRRAFNLRIAEEVNRSLRYQARLALILFDLDDFKKVNDNHGHLVGDRLLTTVGMTIKKTIRSSDLAYRYGGEEFAVICPQTDLSGAYKVAERLRITIDQTEFAARDINLQATVSAGVSCLRSQEMVEELVDRADQALYLAKNKGKNRVYTEEDL